MKLAVLSYTLPPSTTSHGAIIRRLLAPLPADSYILITSNQDHGADAADAREALPGRLYQMPPPWELQRGWRFGLAALRRRINRAMAMPLRARQIVKILRRERCDSLVVCTGGAGLIDFPASWIAARWLRIPYHVYLLDRYGDLVRHLNAHPVLGWFERRVIRGATSVITHNTFHQRQVRQELGVNAVLLYNPVDLDTYRDVPHHPAADGRFHVVYTGGIGMMNADAIRRLADAAELNGDPRVVVDLHTNYEADARAAGITAYVTYHGVAPLGAMPRLQRDADVLFLPLAFEVPDLSIIVSAAPGKTAEYLAARRPILVHVPKGSFVADYFRRNECGLVVDEPDVHALADALQRLKEDGALRERLAERAWECAVRDHDLVKNRQVFLDLVLKRS